ncbi:MAG: hypothetical protein GF401_10600 [Chitinivibrionales bacterium]|nr:hypothetical protein [Chitinivibrionales bacterium]
MKKSALISLLFIALGAVRICGISENDVVVLALEQSSEFRIMRLNRLSDSLFFEKKKAGWLPLVELSTEQGVAGSEDSDLAGLDSTNYESSYGIDISQNIPGGGTVSAGIEERVAAPLEKGAVEYGAEFSIGFTQPLLRGAWEFGEQEYTVTIARFDSREFALEQKKELCNRISEIRQSFWTWYEKTRQRDIYIGEKKYAKQRLAIERKRLVLGEGTPLDTLSAALELLQAEQRLLNAEYELSLSKKNLSSILAIDPDSLELDSSITLEIFDPPESDTFIAMAEKFDPQLKIYETMHKRLEYEIAFSRNTTLPDLDLKASYSRINSDERLFSSGKALLSNNLVKLILNYSFPAKERTIALRQARLRGEVNRQNREQYKRDLAVELSDLIEQWGKEKQGFLITLKAEEIAEKQLEAAAAGYSIGAVDNLSYLKARNDFTKAAIERLQKEVTLKKLEIIFDRVTGMVLNKFGVTFQ